jgi:hypothetical protein
MAYYEGRMIKCIDCKMPKLTWADQRRQFGRAIRRGLTVDEAKALMPRCQKCLTQALKHWNVLKPLPNS